MVDFYKPKFDEAVLVSYPRSGNTWMRYVLANFLYSNKDHNLRTLKFTFPDVYHPENCNDKNHKPRILKSHESFKEETKCYSKVVYIYRDPRDVALSYYDFLIKCRGIVVTFDKYIDRFVNGDTGFGRWDDHVNSWSKAKDINMMTVSYENMHYYPIETFGSVISFLGFVRPNAEKLFGVLEKSKFSKVQEDVKKIDYHVAEGFSGGVSGKPGAWKEKLSVPHVKKIEKAFWRTMNAWGYR